MNGLCKGKLIKFKYKAYELIGRIFGFEKCGKTELIRVRVELQAFCISKNDIVEIL